MGDFGLTKIRLLKGYHLFFCSRLAVAARLFWGILGRQMPSMNSIKAKMPAIQ